jgi:hypothetical protein
VAFGGEGLSIFAGTFFSVWIVVRISSEWYGRSRFLLPFMQGFEQNICFFCVGTYQILDLRGIGGEIIQIRFSCLEKID